MWDGYRSARQKGKKIDVRNKAYVHDGPVHTQQCFPAKQNAVGNSWKALSRDRAQFGQQCVIVPRELNDEN